MPKIIQFFPCDNDAQLQREYVAAVAAFDAAAQGNDEISWVVIDRLNDSITAIMSRRSPDPQFIHTQLRCLDSSYVREQFLSTGNATRDSLLHFILARMDRTAGANKSPGAMAGAS